MAAELAPSSKRNRTRSPSYPYLDLQSALEKAAVLWHAEGRHAASISVVMQHWGYKEESSTGYSCVAALKKFGLVDHDGMGETRQMKLSGLALRILLDDDPQSDERRAALREAALGPRIHAELWERYGIDLPSDQSLKRFLVLERSFNEASVDELLAEYKGTMAFAGLAARGGGRPAGDGEARSRPAAPTPWRRFRGCRRGRCLRRFPPNAPPRRTSHERSCPPAPLGRARHAPCRPAPSGRRGGAAPPPRRATSFGERDAAAYADDERFAEEALAGARPSSRLRPCPQGKENGGPWSMPRRELPVPLDNGLVASVPYPMTEEDFSRCSSTRSSSGRSVSSSRRRAERGLTEGRPAGSARLVLPHPPRRRRFWRREGPLHPASGRTGRLLRIIRGPARRCVPFANQSRSSSEV